MNVSGIIGLGAALAFLGNEGLETIRHKEDTLMDYALNALATVPRIELYGPQDSSKSVGVIPFNLEGHVPEEIAFYLDQECHVMIRSRFALCTQCPSSDWYSYPGTLSSRHRLF